ncbi:MAG: integrase arm-type DNA-binding domain-containing protein [Alphaproteobacteria bacterium]|nr:integrase arm-type DNA-binding domain-containing protein [Alphaproteobacteria bacterium]
MSGRLTAATVRGLRHSGASTRPERHPDGHNLYLQITPAGSKSWLLRYRIDGRERFMGLGSCGDPPAAVPLSEARRRAAEARGLLAAGVDPLDERRAAGERRRADREAAAAATFAAIATRLLAERGDQWRNVKHRQQWQSTLANYAFPALGSLPVASIGADEIEAVLRPIWRAKPETAGRLRNRILEVLRFARAHGLRPASATPVSEINESLRDRLAQLGALKRAAGYGHHPALDWRQAPLFWRDLCRRDSVSALALQFLILTAARTGEVIGATWREIDRDAAVWVVPADRMKAGREHRVPLPRAALAVLARLEPLACGLDALIFPGPRRGKPLSNMALTQLLRGMAAPESPDQPPRWRDPRTDKAVTVHGWRSTFRDWCAEASQHAREVAEAALAHVVRDKVEAAYQRGDFLEKRRALMVDWQRFLASETGSAADGQ